MIGTMGIAVDLPGRERLELEHLLLDVNGTLTERGRLIDGVEERLARVAQRLEVRVLSADTLGTLDAVSSELGIPAQTVGTGAEKERYVRTLGAESCVAVGNGANDASMLAAAALGIAVVGPEGAAGEAVRAADVVCRSVLDALDLLLDERLLAATLRA
jgi:P-type E1-E2 ATPase